MTRRDNQRRARCGKAGNGHPNAAVVPGATDLVNASSQLITDGSGVQMVKG